MRGTAETERTERRAAYRSRGKERRGCALSLSKKSLREFERAASPLIFNRFLTTCAFAPVTAKPRPVFRGCGVLRTVLAPSALRFASGLRTFAPATLKACPVFRGCGVLRTVLAPSALHFASGLRITAKMAFSKEQIFDLRLKMHSPPRLLPIRPRTALTLVRGYALCGALRAVLKG